MQIGTCLVLGLVTTYYAMQTMVVATSGAAAISNPRDNQAVY